MKVLFNAVSAKSGGAATYVSNLLSSIGDGKNQFLFLVPTGTQTRNRIAGPGVLVIDTDIGYKSPVKRLLWDQFNLRSMLISQNIDLLVSTSDFGLFFSPCPQILLVRNSLFFSESYRDEILKRKPLGARLDYLGRRLLVHASIRAADLVLTATNAMRQQVTYDLPSATNKTVVNEFGAPLEKFAGSRRDDHRFPQNRSGGLRLLYVSEYADYKNLSVLLRAVRYVLANTAVHVLLTVTMDPDTFKDFESVTRDEDERLARDPQLMETVKFVGGIPYAQVQDLYRDADVLVFPSLAESFGHPLVEAMASGLPILASDIAVHREVCGDAALYFEPKDIVGLGKLICLLAEDEVRRQILSQAGHAKVEAFLPWKEHVRRLKDHMGNLLGKRPLAHD